MRNNYFPILIGISSIISSLQDSNFELSGNEYRRHREELDNYVVVQNMKEARKLEHQVDSNCWISIVSAMNTKSIETSFKDLLKYGDTELSPGAKFCSMMNTDIKKKQEMALGLTKCHLYASGRSEIIPKPCVSHQVYSEEESFEVQECLQSLDQASFLIYSQFFTHTELMCQKLTEEMRIHSKNLALDQFIETSAEMDAKLREMNEVLKRYKETSVLFDDLGLKIEDMKNIEHNIQKQIDTVDERMEAIITNSVTQSFDTKISTLTAQVCEIVEDF